MEDSVFQRLPGALLPWYEANHRVLPWRQSREPYHIWLSEIMLQQTRVEAVKGYYQRFLEALPTVEALAHAEDTRLHKLWEGLGYYSRVRNLKKAAICIMQQHGGQFPKDYAQVLALPGIGEYTAGAICSIAFGQPTAAVDGNVLRVVTRLTEDPTPIDTPALKRSVKAALEQVYPREAGMFTQALMELGATLCGPNRPPRCEECPCRSFCGGALHGTAQDFPVKKPKVKRRQEQRTVLILSCDGSYALQKRPDTGLLAGLYQFPNLIGQLEPEQALAAAQALGLRPMELQRRLERKHIFTHIQWDMTGYYIEVHEPAGDFLWLTSEQITQQAALPTAFRQFWEERNHV
jgi:A/G-specific adenine glycosylase